MDSIDTPEKAREYISKRRVGWLNLQITRFMIGGEQQYFPALNFINNGVITNLDSDIIVEVPAVVGPDSVKPVAVGALPDQVLPICALHGKITNIVADATALGDRDLALQALLLDPFVPNLQEARDLLADMLEYNKDYYTRF